MNMGIYLNNLFKTDSSASKERLWLSYIINKYLIE